jgi:hypothetical protein
MTPYITVAIGAETRIYFAFVTTAPSALDAPNTITLDEGPFWDIVGFAADPVPVDALRARMHARLVLVDSMQRAWQRLKYSRNHHLLLEADPWLAGLTTLQFCLWQRLEGRVPTQVVA